MLGKLSTRGRGFLHTVNPADSVVPPMRVRGSATIPLVSLPDNRVRNVTVRVISKLPYGLIFEASFFRAPKRISDFGSGKGSNSKSSASWVSFADESVGRLTSTLVDDFCKLTARTPDDGPDRSSHTAVPSVASSPSIEPLVFEDDSKLHYKDVRPTAERQAREAGDHGGARDGVIPGFVSEIAGGTVSVPMPQDEKRVIVGGRKM